MYELTVALNVGRWLLVLAAAVFLIKRLFVLRVGDERNCRDCGYLLEHLPETSDRCPECGLLLSEPNAIRIGHRHSPVRPILILLASVGLWFGIGFGINAIDARQREYFARPMRLVEAARLGDVTAINRLLAIEPNLIARARKQGLDDLAEWAVWADSPAALDIFIAAEQRTVPYPRQPSVIPRSLQPSSVGTLIHLAAVGGNVKVLAHLLDKGCSIELADTDGSTLLQVAVQGGRAASVDVLIKRGASVNAKDPLGQTPLLLSLARHNVTPAVVHALLAAGADPNLAALDGKTPLHHALANGEYDAAKRLIAQGADIGVRDKYGMTPFAAGAVAHAEPTYSLAAVTLKDLHKRDGIAAVRKMLAADPVLVKLSADWGTILCNTDDIELMTALLDAGADPNARTPQGETPLHLRASEWKRLAQVKLLLDRGADVNAATPKGVVPLARALEQGDDEVVSLMLERGAKVDHRDAAGGDLMQYAALCRDEIERKARVKTLLDRGLPMSPAAAIALNQNDELRRLIAENPSSVSEHPNVYGYRPLHYAIRTPNNDAVVMLLAAGADVNAAATIPPRHTPLHLAMSYANDDAAMILIRAGADLTAKVGGLTPLHAAAGWKRDVSVVKLLLERNADIEARDRQDNTPLHAACARGNVEAARVLLAAGANREALNKENKTPADVITTTDARPAAELKKLFGLQP